MQEQDLTVDAEYHLRGLACAQQHAELALVCLRDTQLHHVSDGAVVHVEAAGAPAGGVGGAKLRHELRGVVPAVVGHDGGELS